MTTRPLPLRAWQVSAALDDRLSVLVVALKPQPAHFTPNVIDITSPVQDEDTGEWGQWETLWSAWTECSRGEPLDEVWRPLRLPLSVGDRLWARETWANCRQCGYLNFRADVNRPRNCAACDAHIERWKPSVWATREESRLTLDVTEVRVCRLHDVTEDEARAAGAKPWTGALQSYRTDFYRLWNDQHGPGAWERNDWVAVARVEVHHRNIDSLAPRGNQCVASIEGVQP